MKLIISLLLIVSVVSSMRTTINKELDETWAQYKTKYNKQYEQGVETIRRIIFEENVKVIERHNREFDLGKHTYTLGLNHFADMTNDEYRQQVLGVKFDASKVERTNPKFMKPLNSVEATEVDWRTKGFVTGVKNQGQCGSCWAFSTTGSLEGQHFRKTNQLISLSEQNLVDCSGNYGNLGCNGGLMDSAFKYIKANKGIDTEASYPYEAQNGQCRFKRSSVGATVTGFVDIQQESESDLKSAAASVGPISVAIDAGHQSFQLYSGGVYNEPACSQTQLDHGVLVVGYGTQGTQDYWIVKNSWGAQWGQQGYIWMSRNNNNQCGIATAASYPTV